MHQQLNPHLFETELEGISYEQISAILGEPCHTEKILDLMLYIWRLGDNKEYYIVLLFQNGICLKCFDEGIDQQPV